MGRILRDRTFQRGKSLGKDTCGEGGLLVAPVMARDREGSGGMVGGAVSSES